MLYLVFSHLRIESNRLRIVIFRGLFTVHWIACVTEETQEIRFVCMHTNVVSLSCDAGYPLGYKGRS